ncbi:MAG TPA: MBL fold metallo-hydrolase, partial [Candidatus Acidoferrum sp.]|nr:MBL fold metallo-hydrolase [Candidatus Acidoferrum sp.]
ILTEATYGASAHADRQTVETEFLDKIIDVLAKGGSVLIPSFAVGRAQEVLAILATRPEFAQGKYPVFIDGMIAKMNAIYDAYSQSGQDHSLNPDLPSGLLGKDSFWRSVKNRGALLKASQPKVILSTSGMLEGPALDYLKAMINNDANMVVIVGYQPEGRLGRQLLAGDEEVEISGKNRLVKIQVYQAAFSAHADRVQLVEQIAASGSELRAVYGIHGEGHAIRKLMKAVQERLPHVTAEPLQAGKTYSL